jgi:hypothetical protein
MYARMDDRETQGSTILVIFGWLVFTQLIVLASIYVWVELSFYNEVIRFIPGLTSQHNPYILLLCTYPAVPMVFSALAWLGMLTRKYMLTLVCSSGAALPALLLLLWVASVRLF